MRLILNDPPAEIRSRFSPLCLSRPLWELRCGMTSLGEKMIAQTSAAGVAGFLPEYLAETTRTRTSWPVNDPASLAGDDLLIVDSRLKAEGFDVAQAGPSEVGLDEDGVVLYARVSAADASKLDCGSIKAFLAAAKQSLPTVACGLSKWEYIWDLVLANPNQITVDFAAAGRSGTEGTVEQPNAIRGSASEVYIAPGAEVHPMVVLDAKEGPIYLDENVVVHPFTRIEGPCFVGRDSILLGAKCREGNSIGPVCRVGGEIEESIIQGYSNKYHDGFLGHAYVGEWVNLGAMTTNSDLKNDYSSVSVSLDGKRPVDTGSTKVGSLIGDHTKTSIGVLFNTGCYVGAMSLILATGKPLAKFIPSFSWFMEGAVTKGFGKNKIYETARKAMPRRGCQWTDAEEAMWEEVFKMTAPMRDELIRRGRKHLLKK